MHTVKKLFFGLLAAGALFLCVPAHATIACVQGGTGCTNTTTTLNSCSSCTSLALTFPASITATHLVAVVGTSFHLPTGVTGNAGAETFTLAISQVGAANQFAFVYYVCSSVGGYTAITLALPAGSFTSAATIELSGAATSACTDGTTSATATSAAMAPGSLTPTVSGDAFVAGGWNANSAGTLAWTGANSLFSTSTNEVGNGAFLISTTAGAQAASWTIGSAQWAAVVVAFKPPGSAIINPPHVSIL
jgi:hypothetical protein